MTMQRASVPIGFTLLSCRGCGSKFEAFVARNSDAPISCHRCRTGHAPKDVVRAGYDQARNFAAWMAERTERRIWIEGLLKNAQIPFGPPRRAGGDGTSPSDWAKEGRRRDRLNAALRLEADRGATDAQVVEAWKRMIAQDESTWQQILSEVRKKI